MLPGPPAINKANTVTVMRMQKLGIPWLPLLSVAELLMSPVMKEDSCFLTVSFHIRLIRLYVHRRKEARQKERRRKRRVTRIRRRVRKNNNNNSKNEGKKVGVQKQAGEERQNKEMW